MTFFRVMVLAGTLAACDACVTQAEAALQPLPDGTVYDTTLKVTWLANANLAATQNFGLKINANGTMDYATALQWVAQLNAFNGVGYLGHNNWTLPTTSSIDASCSATGPNGNNFGKNCMNSSMGSLFYRSLGLQYPNTAVPIPNNTTGPFSNFQPYMYWSGTGDSTNGYATFWMNTGWRGSNVDDHYSYALPMIKGNPFGISQASGTGTLRISSDKQTVYDPIADVTWLANANLAKTQQFGLCVNGGDATCINPDGSMSHTIALSWIKAMNDSRYLNQTTWQLPSFDSCGGFNCTGSGNPMGTLFYQQLGFSRGASVVPLSNLNVGPFNNVQPGLYWSCGSPDTQPPCQGAAPASNFEWSFSFGNGFQGTDVLGNNLYVMAYYPGSPASNAFTIANRGGKSVTSSGTGTASLGYAQIQPNSGSTTPSGVAIFDFRQNNTLVSEVGVPATPTMLSGRMYVEIGGTVNTGLAIANPSTSPANISFYFTDVSGNPAGSGNTTIGAGQQMAQFLDQVPFKVYTSGTVQGTFTFLSSVPIAVVGLRGSINERGDFLMSTLPVIDTTAVPNSGTTVVPHFADGGGWTTKVLLVNPTENAMTGTLQFMAQTGVATNLTIAGLTNSVFSYSIPGRTSQKLSTSGVGASTVSGSIRIVPSGTGAGPTPLVVFSYKPYGVTLSEAGVPVTSGSAFRTYVESSGIAGQAGNIQSGIAIANTSTAPASVIFDVTDLSGATSPGVTAVTVSLPGLGQTAKYLSDIFPNLPNPFKGVVRLTASSGVLSVVGLRIRFNERGDLLFTTTPPSNENSPAASMPIFFPQVADGGGYTTQFILFSATAGQSASGDLELVRQDGSPLVVTLR